MVKNLSVLFAAAALLFAVACGDDTESDPGEGSSTLTKSEAADKLEEDELEYDPCEEYGWYGDGECDEFCPEPDPACEGFDVGENQSQNDGTNQGDYTCNSDADCMAGGCSGQLCHHVDNALATTCEWLPEYACYEDEITTCGCIDGTCGWAQTEALDQCLDDAANTVEPNAEENSDEVCEEVVTYGTDPDTDECKAFPTPCDVPEGWDKSYTGCEDTENQEEKNQNQEENDSEEQCQAHSECVVGGCNSELCYHEDDPAMGSTCAMEPEHACYQDESITTCGCFEGACGWEDTEELQQCLEDKG